MSVLDHWRHTERSYWSVRSLLKRAISCSGKWVVLSGNKVLAISDSFDELRSIFADFKNPKEFFDHFLGAICVCIGNEKIIYRISPEDDFSQITEVCSEINKKMIE